MEYLTYGSSLKELDGWYIGNDEGYIYVLLGEGVDVVA